MPTQLVIIWSVWLLYLCFSILNKNISAFFISGILAGLVWHVHVGLIPLMLLVLVCLLLSKQKIPPKQLFLAAAMFIFLMLPYFIFEIKHHFPQTKSLILPLTLHRSDVTYLDRLHLSLDGATLSLSRFLALKTKEPVLIVLALFTSSLFFLKSKQVVKLKHVLILYFWPLLLVMTQIVTKRDISDYCFNSAMIVSILIASLIAAHFLALKKYWPYVLSILFFFFVWNLSKLLNYNLNNSYSYKKKVVDYIKTDYSKNSYPCAAVNYVASLGVGVGFRYLLWWEGIKTVNSNAQVPVYKILIPEYIYNDTKDATYGLFAIQLPHTDSYNFNSCTDPKYKELEPLGYTS